MNKALQLFEQIQRLNALPEIFPAQVVDYMFTKEVRNAALPPAVTALLHLRNDDLDSCHEIVQQNEMPDENYLHAILHRREKDFSNARYWFRRVGKHPVLKKLEKSKWTPESFVNACEKFLEKSSSRSLEQELREWQAMEMQLLFNHLLEQL